MGLLIDSSVLVFAEREELPVTALLDKLQKTYRATEVFLSAISVVELENGYHRANSPQRAVKRRAYLDTVFSAIPTKPVTHEIAQTIARVDAGARKT